MRDGGGGAQRPPRIDNTLTAESSVKSQARFISFEGIDGCGKSTVIGRFACWLDEVDIPYIRTREPGGTPLGENIRRLLLDPSYRNMDEPAEVLLYTASRAQLVQEVILPNLQKGTWVLADRFIDATLAYQGYGRRLDLTVLRQIQAWACRNLWPHHTVLLDCDVHLARQRMQGRPGALDRMERQQLSFHRRVRAGYLELAKLEPQRLVIVDSSQALEKVLEDLREVLWRPLQESILRF